MIRILQRCVSSGLFTLGLCLFLGCSGGSGPSPLGTAPVDGIVTLDGKPFGPGILEFVPTSAASTADRKDAARMASADVKSDGAFVMGSYSADDGVVPGTYKVRITSGSKENSMPGPEIVIVESTVTVAKDGQKGLKLDLLTDKKAKGAGGLLDRKLGTDASVKLGK